MFAMKATGFSARCGFSGVVMGQAGQNGNDVKDCKRLMSVSTFLLSEGAKHLRFWNGD